MDIGTIIKNLRREKGYTLKEFGKSINMSASFLSDIENNRSKPSLMRCKDIAAGLQVSVSALLGECDKRKDSQIDAQSIISFHSPEGKQITQELSDFENWSPTDKQELIAYLLAKRIARKNR